MSLLNCKSSLVHYLKTVVLPQYGYTEQISFENPTLKDASNNIYSLQYGDVMYADPSGHINPSGIAVYDSGRRLELDEYGVDCVNGNLLLSSAPSGTLSCSYSRYTVGVRDAFPEAEEFEAMNLPVICVDFQEQDNRPFAIGVEATYWDIMYFIDIFATSDAMRLQLTDRIQQGMRLRIPVADFESSQPLNYDGTINKDFDMDSSFQFWIKIRSKPRGRMVNVGSVSEKEKYRSVVDGYLTRIR